MIEWSDSQLMIRDAFRRFVEAEIVPHVEELEHGSTPPYEILRKMYTAFGMSEMAASRFDEQIAREIINFQASIATIIALRLVDIDIAIEAFTFRLLFRHAPRGWTSYVVQGSQSNAARGPRR